MSLKPHDRTETQDEKLQKKRAGRVPNGLSVDPRKSRHLHHSQQRHSDQENRPCLGRTQGRKKKNLKKRHGTRICVECMLCVCGVCVVCVCGVCVCPVFCTLRLLQALLALSRTRWAPGWLLIGPDLQKGLSALLLSLSAS
ncbi:hypothetical protein P4O66_005541, partial [Electrophorus voltai]